MKCPQVEAGEGLVRRQSAGEPRPGIWTGCQWKTAPHPSLKFGTNDSQNAGREGFSPPPVSLKTLPDMVLSPIGSGPL